MNNVDELVTVGVLVYNQRNTIIELLDSIYNQTYNNIELVISDDCSTDDSVALIREWLRKYGERFVRVELLCSERNLGISSNRNKNLNASKGSWYKPIDGDDVLCTSCIVDFMEYHSKHPEAVIIDGKMLAMDGNVEFQRKIDERFNPAYFELSPEAQLKRLVFGVNIFVSQGACIYDAFKIKAAGIHYDERIPMIDDFPFWINVLKAGFKLDYMDKPVMIYRPGGNSNSHRDSMRFFRSDRLFRYYYLFPEWCKADYEDAVETMVREECETYAEVLRLEHTKAYRLGKLLLKPLCFLSTLLTPLKK